MKRIVIGSDHAGFALKEPIKEYLSVKGYEVEDYGVFSEERANYPEKAFKVAEAVAGGEFEFGILVCGTGIGMSIAANKVNGIRAAHIESVYSALMAKKHNNANILCMGARVIGMEVAKMAVDAWLESDFEGGRHYDRVKMIDDYVG